MEKLAGHKLSMQRIAVIGSAGAGKTAFALRLGEILGIEVIHLDKHYWKYGWEETPYDIWAPMVEEMAKGERWIIDGNYRSTMDIRLRAADTIIMLDYSRILCVWRGIRRIVRHYGKVRPDLSPGCPEKFDIEFFRWIWIFRKKFRPEIMRKFDALPDSKSIHVFTKPSQADEFLEYAHTSREP